jgi:hypothetical protein
MPLTPARPQVELAGAEKLGNEVRWIAVSPAYYEVTQRRMRRSWWMAPFILVAIAASIYFVFGVEVLQDPKVRTQVIAVGVVMILQVAYLPFAGRFVRKQLAGYRLGASAGGLSYESSKSQGSSGPRAGRAPWRDVYYDGRILLAGRKELRVRTPKQGDWIFDAEELRKAILVHVPRNNLLTPGQLQMRMAGGLIWLLMVIVAAVLVWALIALNIIPVKP